MARLPVGDKKFLEVLRAQGENVRLGVHHWVDGYDCNVAEATERRIMYVVYRINCHPLSNPGPTVHP